MTRGEMRPSEARGRVIFAVSQMPCCLRGLDLAGLAEAWLRGDEADRALSV